MEDLYMPDLTDKLTIGDLYYNNQKVEWMNKMMLKNEQVQDGRVVSTISVKMDKRRSTFHKLDNYIEKKHPKMAKFCYLFL